MSLEDAFGLAAALLIGGSVVLGLVLEFTGCRCRMRRSPLGTHACCPKCGRCESGDGRSVWYVSPESV
jgi:hypothetical protein